MLAGIQLTLGLVVMRPLLTVSPSALRPTSPLMISGDADFCELTTLDAAGSAVFGSHFGVEAWVCQDESSESSKATSLHKIELQQKHEGCHVMHQGKMVRAFSTARIKAPVPGRWQRAGKA